MPSISTLHPASGTPTLAIKLNPDVLQKLISTRYSAVRPKLVVKEGQFVCIPLLYFPDQAGGCRNPTTLDNSNTVELILKYLFDRLGVHLLMFLLLTSADSCQPVGDLPMLGIARDLTL